MSGITKSVKKVFKKVVKPIMKIAPIALGVGALVFTAGAALGVPGMAGGWGGAVSSLTSKLGATGTLANVLTGALTQAGYGAVLGAGTSLLTGGDFSKGALYGAGAGAASGGLMGGFGYQTDPLGGIGENPASETAMDNSALKQDLPPSGLDDSAIEAGAREGAWKLPSSPAYNPPSDLTKTTTGGGLLDQGGWVERNQGLVGYGVQGLGQGLMGMAEGDDMKEAGKIAVQRDREEREYIARNYGSGNVPGYRSAAAPVGNPTPAQRFDPASYQGQWVYDPAQGRVVFVPNQQQQQ